MEEDKKTDKKTSDTLRELMNLQEAGKFESIKRVFLFRFVFENFFEDKQDKYKAFESHNEILKYCLANELDFLEVVADILDNKHLRISEHSLYNLPEFIVVHYHYWIQSVNYLAYGSGELERAIPLDILARAKEYAYGYMQHYYNYLFKE